MKFSNLHIKKKWVIISCILGFLLILFFTNPSSESFNTWSNDTGGFRKYNLYLFSVYQSGGDYYRSYYLGIAGSFFWIKRE